MRPRLILAVILSIVAAFALFPALQTPAPSEFTGSVIALPADANVDLFLQVEYHPVNDERFRDIQRNDLAITVSNLAADRDTFSRWYILTMGDARIRQPIIVERDGSVRDVDFADATHGGIDFRLFQVELRSGDQLVGTPRTPPAVTTNGSTNITMPLLLSTEPTERIARDGGLIYMEQAILGLAS